MKPTLHIWWDERHLGVIEHTPRDDRWSLSYDPAWAADPAAFPLAPALPLNAGEAGAGSASIKRFIEHLLPEGRALDVASQINGLAKSNSFGLIRALGAETAGALRFTAEDRLVCGAAVRRELPLQELNERIGARAQTPFSVWDGQVRMSIAGLQDKLLVYLDRPLDEGGRLFLVDGGRSGGRLASTHLLKPDAEDPRTPHLVVNEHYCMSLARRMGLPAAEVTLLRTPRPVLLVRRFDRQVVDADPNPHIQRKHIVDACQACDLPVSFKYERHLGNAPELRQHRDGMSFERLFGCAALSGNKAVTRLTLLRWALFQFLCGNSDAHGKNFTFFVRPGGLLEPAPWYDLVSVLQYQGFDTELAMAFGDVFVHAELTPYALADFAHRCGIARQLLQREGLRLSKLASTAAAQQQLAPDYQGEEIAFTGRIAHFVQAQARRLAELVTAAVKVRAEDL